MLCAAQLPPVCFGLLHVGGGGICEQGRASAASSSTARSSGGNRPRRTCAAGSGGQRQSFGAMRGWSHLPQRRARRGCVVNTMTLPACAQGEIVPAAMLRKCVMDGLAHECGGGGGSGGGSSGSGGGSAPPPPPPTALSLTVGNAAASETIEHTSKPRPCSGGTVCAEAACCCCATPIPRHRPESDSLLHDIDNVFGGTSAAIVSAHASRPGSPWQRSPRLGVSDS